MSKRVLIISDSIFRQTGYSTVANNIIENIDPSFKIAQLGLSHIPTDYKELNIDYYAPVMNHQQCCGAEPAFEYYNSETKTTSHFKAVVTLDELPNLCNVGQPNTGDPYSFDSSYFVIQHYKPDIVITINDIWGMYKLQFLKNREQFKLISYLAVDSECFPVLIQNKETIDTLRYIGGADKIVVFTDWAKETINKSAEVVKLPPFQNIDVIPHGVDQNKFYSLPEAQIREFRNQFFKFESDDVFLIGSVNRNQPRKRLDAAIQILKILIDKYEKPNGKKFYLHFHCAIKDSHGWDLPWLGAYYGVQDRIILDSNLKPGVGVPDDLLNMIMNSYDAHLVPTNSEGWGLSILETMACGIPNIISDYSAHGDWAEGYALPIKLAAKIHEPITNHIKGIIDVEHAAEQIGKLYNSHKVQKEYRKRSLQLAERLQWKNICVQWNKLLEDIDISDLDEGRYDFSQLEISGIRHFPPNPLETEFTVQEI